MKLEPCPVCKSAEQLNIKDCGYSTFNIGHVGCKKCGFELEYRNLDGNEDYIKHWNLDMADIDKIVNLKEKEKTILLLATFSKHKSTVKKYLSELK